MKRCLFCGRIILPWHRRGWRIIGRVMYFYHPRCRLIWQMLQPK